MNRIFARRTALTWAVTVVLSTNGACAGRQHVRLEPAPSGNRPGPERLAAYERLRVAGSERTVGLEETATTPRELLVLADGRRIYYPSDLLPVVGAESPTAVAAKRARKADGVKSLMNWLFLGGITVGIGTIVTGAALESAGRSPGGELAVYGLTGTLVVATLALLTLGIPFQAFKDEKLSAFLTYEQSLQEWLQICTEGQQTIPCEDRSVEPGLARP